MLQVLNVTKRYGRQAVVDDISFTLQTGEVVGFLGPNGAGKSTTMKMITGFITPTAGQISCFGYEGQRNPLLIKRMIGYLPESNPLYHDMYVKEFLNFIGGMYDIPQNIRNRRIKEVIEQCGLAPQAHKLIGSLSKGYKQRVGLAQAIIHEPKILILDEPTSGLDPNQILDIRQLIKDNAKDKIVLFSSHIMQEVEAICDKVILIHQGRLIAHDTLRVLTNAGADSLETVFHKLTQTAAA